MDEPAVGNHPLFDAWMGRSYPWGPEGRWSIAFGGGVTDQIMRGLDGYLALNGPGSRRLHSALLGCVPWLTDAAIVDRILRFDSSCVVVSKPHGQLSQQFGRLRDAGPGFPLEAFPRFEGLVPHVDGQPARMDLFGDRDLIPNKRFGSLRIAGVGKRWSNEVVPLVHAKLLLLGQMAYSDEGPLGNVGDFYSFTPHRVWLGSANFTRNAGRSVEFGLWSDDPSLLARTTEFLVDLLEYSEAPDSQSIKAMPELVYGDDGMSDADWWDYMREFGD